MVLVETDDQIHSDELFKEFAAADVESIIYRGLTTIRIDTAVTP